MSLRRYNPKRDANEQSIVNEICEAGWFVERISKPNWPDLLCAKAGRLVLCEIKNPDGRDRISAGQLELHRLLLLYGVKVVVARSAEEFLRAVGDLH
jgi:hypothetical protein